MKSDEMCYSGDAGIDGIGTLHLSSPIGVELGPGTLTVRILEEPGRDNDTQQDGE